MRAFLMAQELGLEIGVVFADSSQKVAKVLGGVLREGLVVIPASKFELVDPEKPFGLLGYRRGPFFFTTFAGKDANISIHEVPFMLKFKSAA